MPTGIGSKAPEKWYGLGLISFWKYIFLMFAVDFATSKWMLPLPWFTPNHD